jgi:hypothetical protein
VTLVRPRGSLDLSWGTKGLSKYGLGASGLLWPRTPLQSINQDPESGTPLSLVTRSNVDDLDDPVPSATEIYSIKPLLQNR